MTLHMTGPVNTSPSVVSYFNSETPVKEWRAIDHEFYAFTKQVCREEGVVSVSCNEMDRVFRVVANKKARKNLSHRYGYNTWHGSHGHLAGVLFRIDILPAAEKERSK